MKASIKWLKEFVDFTLSPQELAHALTMAGFEVEGMIPNSRDEDDTVLVINITPNRPDCLSIAGIAREISAILKIPFRDCKLSVKKEDGQGPRIEIKDQELCSRYASRIIRGVRVGPSPSWLSKRLESHGFRPANNIVDITNYVLLEMGHPLHAFDMDKLSGNRIVVKTAGSADKFITLDNEERILSREMLLIWDAEKPVAIAGVMGGLNSEVTDSTVNILLESAYFDPISVRRTSKAVNLTTESTYRFERGTDINRLVHALDRAAQLIIDTAGGTTTKITDLLVKNFIPQSIPVKLKKINDVLGIKVSQADVQEILTSLQIDNRAAGEGITVTPPSFRQDIRRDVDVIEEIARIWGYGKIPAITPTARMQAAGKSDRWNFTKTVKELMIKAGYSEAINYSFLNPADLDKLKLTADDRRRSLIKIRNPLRKEEEALRTTLIPALLDNIRLNISRGEKSLRLFEIAAVFLPSGHKLPDEKMKLAAVYLKDKKGSLWEDGHDGFYDLKGALENLLLGLRIKNYSFSLQGESAGAGTQGFPLDEPYLHPGKSCFINAGGKIIGILGILHPDAADRFDVVQEISILELDIDSLSELIQLDIQYQALPKYPYIERDIAVTVHENITAAALENAIREINSGMIESVRLFDIYTGKSIPKGKKSLAFSIRYRAGDRTLVDDEINELHSMILKHLESTLNAELRS
jgi:phenylalanyl-tRNA synthetase beta chain